MEIVEKERLQRNIEQRYIILGKDLKREFREKYQLLKKEYASLSDEEKQALISRLKQDKSKWKEVSAMLEADKEKVLKRNKEMEALQRRYKKEANLLQGRKQAEIDDVENRFNYEQLVEFRNKGIRSIEEDYNEMNARYDKLISQRVAKIGKLQEFIAKAKQQLEKQNESIGASWDEKYKQFCAAHKNDPTFAKKRVVIPKELLSSSEGKISILQSDLDKCIVTSKKDMAFNLCQEKKAEAINSRNKEFREKMEKYLEALKELQAQIERLNEKKKQAAKTRNDRLVLFKRKVAGEAQRRGITKFSKEEPKDVKRSDTKKVVAAAKKKQSYKAKDRTQSRFMNFIKGTSIYKVVSEKSGKRREQKMEKIARQTSELSKIGLENESDFISMMRGQVQSNPVYSENGKKVTYSRGKIL